jgi:hypothetical protein
VIVNNVCGTALNTGNGTWVQFTSALGAIPDDATSVSLVGIVTSTAPNESLALDNLRIRGDLLPLPAPVLGGVALALLALAVFAIGVFGARQRLAHSS